MAGRNGTEREVVVQAGGTRLEGTLALPPEPGGVVLFAHGSGSSRFSPRNRFVARMLRSAGLGTLLVDLLTPDEEESDAFSRRYRFDIELLAGRLAGVIGWLRELPDTRALSIGLFGASTGAAAALVAAARRPADVGCVVSRGGRPDLAGDALRAVTAPTLLIVGGLDDVVLGLNREAMARMRGEVRLEIVPGATHLFEEPGTLETVAHLARDWFAGHLGPAPAAR